MSSLFILLILQSLWGLMNGSWASSNDWQISFSGNLRLWVTIYTFTPLWNLTKLIGTHGTPSFSTPLSTRKRSISMRHLLLGGTGIERSLLYNLTLVHFHFVTISWPGMVGLSSWANSLILWLLSVCVTSNIFTSSLATKGLAGSQSFRDWSNLPHSWQTLTSVE